MCSKDGQMGAFGVSNMTTWPCADFDRASRRPLGRRMVSGDFGRTQSAVENGNRGDLAFEAVLAVAPPANEETWTFHLQSP